MRPWLLIAVALLAAGAGGCLRKKARVPAAAPPPAPAPVEPTISPSEIQSLESQFEVTRHQLTAQGDKGTFTVKLQLESLCQAGDLDILLGDLKMRSDRRVFLSVEPLVPVPEFEPVTKELTEKELKEGFTHTLALPKVDRAIQAALFLCSDSGATPRCIDNAVLHLQNVPYENDFNLDKDPKYQPPDRIFFFNYLVLEPNHTLALFPRPSKLFYTPDTLAVAAKYHMGRQPASASLERQSLERAHILIWAMRSRGIERSGDGFVMTLVKEARNCPRRREVPVRKTRRK